MDLYPQSRTYTSKSEGSSTTWTMQNQRLPIVSFYCQVHITQFMNAESDFQGPKHLVQSDTNNDSHNQSVDTSLSISLVLAKNGTGSAGLSISIKSLKIPLITVQSKKTVLALQMPLRDRSFLPPLLVCLSYGYSVKKFWSRPACLPGLCFSRSSERMRHIHASVFEMLSCQLLQPPSHSCLF